MKALLRDGREVDLGKEYVRIIGERGDKYVLITEVEAMVVNSNIEIHSCMVKPDGPTRDRQAKIREQFPFLGTSVITDRVLWAPLSEVLDKDRQPGLPDPDFCKHGQAQCSICDIADLRVPKEGE